MRTLNPLLFTLPLLLAGCWLDHGPSTPATPTPTPQPVPTPMETLSGIAAVGAPVVGAIVEIRCDAFTDSAQTGDDGAWTAEIPEGVTPCVLKASGGEPEVTLFSYATAAGTVNITPLTTLVVARAVAASGGGTDLEAAFDADSLDAAALADAIAEAQAEALEALADAGLDIADDFDPFGAEFDAVAGDPHDDLLEAFAAGLADAGLTFSEFVGAWAEHGPDAIPTDDEDTGPGDPTPPTDPVTPTNPVTPTDPTPTDPVDPTDPTDPTDPVPGFLGDTTGATAMIGGNRQTATVMRDFDGYPYSRRTAVYFDATDDTASLALQLRFDASEAKVDQAQACGNGVELTYVAGFVSYTGAPGAGDDAGCTITVTERSDVHVAGTFSGTLYRHGVDEPLTVTDGEFRYEVDLFAAGSAVGASFEGLATGKLGGQGDGAGDAGWSDAAWQHVNTEVSVVDLATPMTYAIDGSDPLDGGAQAIAIRKDGVGPIEGRRFARSFDGDVYFSTLLRATSVAGDNRTRINFGALGLYVGIDDAADPTNHFVANVGPTVFRFGGQVEAGRTYLLVARLWQSTGDSYDRMDAWLDPQAGDTATPDVTATRTPGSDDLRFVNRIGFTVDGQPNDLELDRIRVADTWAALFSAALPAPDPLAKGGECGGGAGETSELPSGPDLIGTCAGEYEVTTSFDGQHRRGSVTIGADNAIDFDTGISYTAADAAAAQVYDRINCCNRIDVIYANGDKFNLHRSSNGVLRTMIFTPSGESAVGVSLLPPLAEGTADGSLLDGNGIVGTVDGVVQIETPQDAFFLSGNATGFNIGGGGVWYIRNVPPVVGVHECGTSSNGVRIQYLNNVTPGGGVSGGGADGGRCTITVDAVTTNRFGSATAVEGRFHAELLTNGLNNIGNPGAMVTDGYFRYVP